MVVVLHDMHILDASELTTAQHCAGIVGLENVLKNDSDVSCTEIKNLLKTLNIAATIAKENGKMTTLTMVPSDEDGKYYVEWLVDDTAKAEIKSTVENSKFKRETIGDIYSILPISEYTNTMVNTGQYTEEYLGKVKLGDGYMGDQTYSIPEDSGNAWFTVMIIAIVIAMGIGVVIIISIIRSKIPEKALGGEVKFEEPVPEKEAPKQPYVPEKPIVMPEAKDPDLVKIVHGIVAEAVIGPERHRRELAHRFDVTTHVIAVM